VTHRDGRSNLKRRLLIACSALALAGSAAAPGSASASGAIYENLAYGPRLAQRLNVFASSTPGAPIVILVHGGGWRYQYALSRFTPESLALQAQGFTVFDINYRQDSERRPAFPVEPDDVMLATEWAIANAAAYNGNAGNVVLLGGSAGGNLVGLAAEQLNTAHPGTVRGVISLSGPMNLAKLVSLVEERVVTNEQFVVSLDLALGKDPAPTGATTAAASEPTTTEVNPVTASPSLQLSPQNCPHWLIFNSEAELMPLSQAQEMATAVNNARCAGSLQVVPGNKHAFAYFSHVESAIFSFIRAN
jgi:acetyl esterase/lipase